MLVMTMVHTQTNQAAAARLLGSLLARSCKLLGLSLQGFFLVVERERALGGEQDMDEDQRSLEESMSYEEKRLEAKGSEEERKSLSGKANDAKQRLAQVRAREREREKKKKKDRERERERARDR